MEVWDHISALEIHFELNTCRLILRRYHLYTVLQSFSSPHADIFLIQEVPTPDFKGMENGGEGIFPIIGRETRENGWLSFQQVHFSLHENTSVYGGQEHWWNLGKPLPLSQGPLHIVGQKNPSIFGKRSFLAAIA